MLMPKTYVFFGNIGAGKGTQVSLLTEVLTQKHGQKVVYLSPGNEFRKMMSDGSYTSGLVTKELASGKLFPLFLVSTVFGNMMIKEYSDPSQHLIFDGVPRNLEQVDMFEKAMEFYGRTDIEIIYVDVSKDEAIKRMKLRGRDDDTPEAIAQRFKEYEENVLPALKRMKKDGYVVHHVNGEQAIDGVHQEILTALGLK